MLHKCAYFNCKFYSPEGGFCQITPHFDITLDAGIEMLYFWHRLKIGAKILYQLDGFGPILLNLSIVVDRVFVAPAIGSPCREIV
jgi:hypothetical protein